MTKSSLTSKKPQSVGREYLEKRLRKQGLSRRRSVKILDAIFGEMSAALARGEQVEFPYGKLTRVRKHFGRWWDAVDDWPANREPYTVEWELSPEGWEQLCGPLEKGERDYLDTVWEAPEPEKRERRGRKKSGRLIGK